MRGVILLGLGALAIIAGAVAIAKLAPRCDPRDLTTTNHVRPANCSHPAARALLP